MRGCAVFWVATAALIVGCGNESALKVAGERLAQAAGKGGVVVRQHTAAALDDLTSAEAIDEVIAGAFCQGVTSLANVGALPGGSDWGSFLVSHVEQRKLGFSHSLVEDKVSDFEAAGNLSQINPRAAQYYVQECLARF